MDSKVSEVKTLGRLIPQKVIAEELGCSKRTVERHAVQYPDFPRPVKMGHRIYFLESELEASKAKLVRQAVTGRATA